MEIGDPKEGEVRVKNKAIGLNFIDIYFRKGVYKAATFPFTPGLLEAKFVYIVMMINSKLQSPLVCHFIIANVFLS